MCGIFGLIGDKKNFNIKSTKHITNTLFRLSESRGKEAAGVAIFNNNNEIDIYKEAIPADLFLKKETYKNLLKKLFENNNSKKTPPMAIIGHSRLVTNGSLEDNNNNQPVRTDNLVGIHNGIVTNDEFLWETYPSMKRKFTVDTEVIFKLIDKFYNENNVPLEKTIQNTFGQIEGAASIAAFVNNKYIILSTNNGSLYLCKSKNNIIIFASEKYILKKVIKDKIINNLIGDDYEILQIKPDTGYIIDLTKLDSKMFHFDSEYRNLQFFLPDKLVSKFSNYYSRELSFSPLEISKEKELEQKEKEFDDSFFHNLKRCTKCLLPETFPLIKFDENGVCNLCNNHEKPNLLGEDVLDEYLSKFRSNSSNKPDCIIAVSGGRDSCYGLHYLKNVMKMNPIAYTYDWGMVTDIARRNIAKITGKLGIEHILVSADIKKKRKYIKKNLTAWLKKPDLGMIPILMAGDKKFKYYGVELQKQNNIKLAIYNAGNRFEKTNFKTGFCNVDEGVTKGVLTLSIKNTFKLISYYLKQYITNPSYLNSSLVDTFLAYYYSYMMPKNYIFLFHYIDWNEKDILSTLVNEYNWEKADDTFATWRIGDGTACFYNYVYYTIAGFTEFDTFRSNQIREGRLTREEALEIVRKENRPRFRAIKTYLDLINMDYNEVMKIIDSIPKLWK